MKQCFKCCKYGHMSLACRHDEACFRCVGKHSNKDCREESSCAACGGKHTVNSEACSARKAERARVNRVKELASPLWPTSSSSDTRKLRPSEAAASPKPTEKEKESNRMKVVMTENEVLREEVCLGPRGQGEKNM